ncbi:MAG: TIM barrel protein, partial [Planctomycetota bacterium]|nr:TIM barrel protein [Planctomycetota bacterium]
TATAEGLLRFVNDIQSPWFGVNLDTGNFHSKDVYKDLAKVAPHAVNVQVKVVIAPQGQPRQPTDFRRIAAILNEVGYSGYTVLEYEEKGNPREECPRYLDQMREALART